MGFVLFLGILILVGYGAYKQGKQLGSRLAYRVGRRHGQRRRLR